jgi:hypothetical protein
VGQLHCDTSRGFVVGQAESIRIACLHFRMCARFARDHRRVGKMWGSSHGIGEFLGEFTEHQVLAVFPDESERGNVPEHGGTAVTEHHLPPVRQGEQLT